MKGAEATAKALIIWVETKRMEPALSLSVLIIFQGSFSLRYWFPRRLRLIKVLIPDWSFEDPTSALIVSVFSFIVWRDSVQNTVASLPGLGNTYLTLVTYSGVRLSNIVLLSADQLVTPPDNVRFDLGALDFKADNIQPGGRVEIGLILPLSSTPVTYYMYGPTPDNTNPHWYEFLYDGTTGAQLIGRATITSPDGTNIERNLIKLVFTDGARGDADLSVNGVVIDTGAPVVTTSGTSSGSMSIWSLFYLAVILIMLKAGQRHSVRKTAGIWAGTGAMITSRRLKLPWRFRDLQTPDLTAIR